MGREIALYGKHKTLFVNDIKECPKCGCHDIRKTTMSAFWGMTPSNKKERSILESLLRQRKAITCFKCEWIEYTVETRDEIKSEIKQCPDILIPRKGSMCLYLPFDTCLHSTEICRIACLAKKEKHPDNKQRDKIKDILLTYPIDVVCNKIAGQIVDDKSLLHWFASGDYPDNGEALSYILRKILHFIMERDLPQNGFTRSPEFLHLVNCTQADAKSYKCDPNNLRIAFTAEIDGEPDYYKIKDKYNLGWKVDPVLLAVPDYQSGNTKLFIYQLTGTKYWSEGGCGTSGSWNYSSKYYSFAKEKMPQDCIKCYQNKRGCFGNRDSS
jgi:hypothetical protein